MGSQRLSLNYQTLKIIFGKRTTRHAKPFAQQDPIRTFPTVFGEAQQNVWCRG